MSNSTIDSANGSAPESAAAPAKAKREHKAKKAKAANEARGKKAVDKSKTDSANKKAEVIAMMKRAKGATLAEI